MKYSVCDHNVYDVVYIHGHVVVICVSINGVFIYSVFSISGIFQLCCAVKTVKYSTVSVTCGNVTTFSRNQVLPGI
jgi:hypothetical protein